MATISTRGRSFAGTIEWQRLLPLAVGTLLVLIGLFCA